MPLAGASASPSLELLRTLWSRSKGISVSFYVSFDLFTAVKKKNELLDNLDVLTDLPSPNPAQNPGPPIGEHPGKSNDSQSDKKRAWQNAVWLLGEWRKNQPGKTSPQTLTRCTLRASSKLLNSAICVHHIEGTYWRAAALRFLIGLSHYLPSLVLSLLRFVCIPCFP